MNYLKEYMNETLPQHIQRIPAIIVNYIYAAIIVIALWKLIFPIIIFFLFCLLAIYLINSFLTEETIKILETMGIMIFILCLLGFL